MAAQETENPLAPETVAELLARWDAGESVFSIELGGLGPDYEQAIQVAAVEFARAGKDYKPLPNKKADAKAWYAICSEALKAIDANLGGLSGAMFGAASWLAYQWCCNGGPAGLYRRAEEKEKEEGKSRLIQICKAWPRAEAAT